jgi:flagellar protein FliL
MRLVFFIVIALLVLGGGGAGAYFYFMQPAEASAGPDAGDDHDIKKKDEKHTKKGHAEELTFVEMDPLILPIVDNTGVTQVISLVIALEVPNKEMAKEVEALTPRLKDAYIQDMYGVLNKYAAMKGGVIQVSVIKERLNKITHEIMGEEKVNDVLLQVVQQRPM